ncbi:hypothetical protein B0I35DRAFT_443596, partial [Stachybotrys elegans]
MVRSLKLRLVRKVAISMPSRSGLSLRLPRKKTPSPGVPVSQLQLRLRNDSPTTQGAARPSSRHHPLSRIVMTRAT